MIVASVETWWVPGDRALFDEKRRGRAAMDWDVVVLRLTADDGTEGVATCLAARSGQVTEGYLLDAIAPILLGRSPHDRERIWHDLWSVDRHLAFFPVFLPGPADVALWDMCARQAGLPLYRCIGAFRESLPVYASGSFHATVDDYVREALHYRDRGITAYKAHPPGPVEVDMQVHRALREAVGPDHALMSDPVGEYTLDQAIRVGRQLEELDFRWFEEPFRDVELHKYAELCRVLDIPIAATETTRGAHWGVAQSIPLRAADIVRADVSWKAGITGTLKIAHLAEAFGLNCEIHTTTMNYMDVVNLHVSCAIRNCDYFEYFVPEENYRLPMADDLPIDANGAIHVPQKPGIGVELDWDLIRSRCHSYRKLTLEDDPAQQQTAEPAPI